jgi:hypothetical protein
MATGEFMGKSFLLPMALVMVLGISFASSKTALAGGEDLQNLINFGNTLCDNVTFINRSTMPANKKSCVTFLTAARAFTG